MYRFLFRPRWIVSHVLIAALTITMIGLGFWQLQRLDERNTLNATVSGRSSAPAAAFDEVVRDVRSVADGTSVDYQATVITGTYLVDDEIVVPGRNSGGGPGLWVATPLQSDSGAIVLILRGSVPSALGDTTAPIERVAPPLGRVEVAGWIRRSERQTGLTPDNVLIEGRSFNRLELPAIADVLSLELSPVMVQLAEQLPPTGSDVIQPIPLPEQTEGSHLSYAVQWFIFSLIALFGYPVILRRAVRARTREAEHSDSSMATDDDPSSESSDAGRIPAAATAAPATLDRS